MASAIGQSAGHLGGIDALVYTPGIGMLGSMDDTDAGTWTRSFATNVTGAALVTAASIPYLTDSAGVALYLSSVSASLTAPWPGLGAYAVSKAALDKMVEAWRVEHPDVGFTRCVVGDCAGGDGDSTTGFADEWDHDRLNEFYARWAERGLVAGTYIDVEQLVAVIDVVLRAGSSLSVPSITIAPRAKRA